MMRTRTIATGAGITGNADCPPAFRRSSSLVPLGLWCCAVSSPAAAPRYYSITHTCKPLTRSLKSQSTPRLCTHKASHYGARRGCGGADFGGRRPSGAARQRRQLHGFGGIGSGGGGIGSCGRIGGGCGGGNQRRRHCGGACGIGGCSRCSGARRCGSGGEK